MLTHDDVDMANRLIRVRAKTVAGESWQPKTRGNRAVPISDALVEILSSYRPSRRTPWFFTSPKGKRWDVDNFSATLRQINQEAGLPWGCLDFRHTFGRLLAQKGESLYKISTLMGNSPDICRRHYAALIPEQMRDVVEFGRSILPGEGDGPEPDPTAAMLQQLLEKIERLEKRGEDDDAPPLRVAR